jgi:RNA polymerase sigma factor (sigma-70 family)
MKRAHIDRLQRFYEVHRQALFTYALARTRQRETAEDRVQDVIMKLLDHGRPPLDLRPYAFRMIRNAAIDELIREAPRAAPSDRLDRNVRALFEEARQSASTSWFQTGIPAWAAGLACATCLLAGMVLAPRPAAVHQAEPKPARPDVLVQFARSDNPSIDSGFFSAGWTLQEEEN